MPLISATPIKALRQVRSAPASSEPDRLSGRVLRNGADELAIELIATTLSFLFPCLTCGAVLPRINLVGLQVRFQCNKRRERRPDGLHCGGSAAVLSFPAPLRQTIASGCYARRTEYRCRRGTTCRAEHRRPC